jgi:hypothetical protein
LGGFGIALRGGDYLYEKKILFGSMLTLIGFGSMAFGWWLWWLITDTSTWGWWV